MPNQKPPLGLRPKSIVNEHRVKEISEAISRYTSAHYALPLEWIQEYNELVDELAEEKQSRRHRR